MGEIKEIIKRYERRDKLKDMNNYTFFNQGQLFLIQEREKNILKFLKKHNRCPLKNKLILEIGCGNGTNLLNFIRYGALPENLFGNDLQLSEIDIAKKLIPAGNFYHGSAEKLPWNDNCFDIVLQATVISSIFNNTVIFTIAKEMLRVTKPNGLILWYDLKYDNPWNPDVHKITKREIIALFPNCSVKIKSVTLIPQISRLLAPLSWILCYIFEKIPFLCSHYLAVIKK